MVLISERFAIVAINQTSGNSNNLRQIKYTNNMKNLNTLILLILLLSISNISCAQTRQSKDEFDVSNFTAIKSSVVANIEVRQASQTSVTAEGSEALLDLLNVKMDNETLFLEMEDRFKRKIRNNSNKLTIYISTPSLTYIDSEGVGNIKIIGSFDTPELAIRSEGVGNIEADNLYAGKVKIDSEGVGNISIKGKAESVEIGSEGVGNINTQKLTTQSAVVISEGVGNVSCYASDYLKIKSEGIGNVTYYGNPKDKNLDKDGIGRIKSGD